MYISKTVVNSEKKKRQLWTVFRCHYVFDARRHLRSFGSSTNVYMLRKLGDDGVRRQIITTACLHYKMKTTWFWRHSKNRGTCTPRAVPLKNFHLTPEVRRNELINFSYHFRMMLWSQRLHCSFSFRRCSLQSSSKTRANNKQQLLNLIS